MDDDASQLIPASRPKRPQNDACVRNTHIFGCAALGGMCLAVIATFIFLHVSILPNVNTVSKDAAAMTQALRNRTDAYLAETDVIVFSMKNKGINDLVGLILQNAATILPADRQAKLVTALDDYLSMFAASATSARKNGLSMSINVPVGSSSGTT
jgi:hypothetical protein